MEKWELILLINYFGAVTDRISAEMDKLAENHIRTHKKLDNIDALNFIELRTKLEEASLIREELFGLLNVKQQADRLLRNV